MTELGEYLRETRTNHGVSLEEAAEDLGVTVSQLENMESGNTRAFQDMYTLKQYVQNYAKYLGLDPEKVIDEFNDFLFEHTSKISLSDILEAEAKRKTASTSSHSTESKKKMVSPYTRISRKNSLCFAPIVLIFAIILFVLLLVYLLVQWTSQEEKIDTELKGYNVVWEEVV